MTSADEPGVQRPNITPLEIIRVIVLLVAVVSLALWGFFGWDMPWNIVAGIGTPLIVLVIWGLFLSPRPVLRVHPFLRALVELLVYVAVTIAWWSMGQGWIGIGFAIVAITAGVIAGRRLLA